MLRKGRDKTNRKRPELLDSREELTLGAIAAAIPLLALLASV